MANMIEKNEYGVRKTILIAPELAFAIPVQVGNTGIDADEKTGKKIIKAGTAIGGSTSVFGKRDEVLNKTTAAEEAQGILLHDVDVTAGANNGSMLVAGYVDTDKIDTKDLPGEDVQKALTRILFMKGI